jgi:hypothetical protein
MWILKLYLNLSGTDDLDLARLQQRLQNDSLLAEKEIVWMG